MLSAPLRKSITNRLTEFFTFTRYCMPSNSIASRIGSVIMNRGRWQTPAHRQIRAWAACQRLLIPEATAGGAKILLRAGGPESAVI
jgi:hypothetical protein